MSAPETGSERPTKRPRYTPSQPRDSMEPGEITPEYLHPPDAEESTLEEHSDPERLDSKPSRAVVQRLLSKDVFECVWKMRVLEDSANDLSFATKVITIRIRSDTTYYTDFYVHERLIRRSSFSVESELAKNNPPIVTLYGIGTTAFMSYVQWLYSGNLHSRLSISGTTQQDQEHELKRLIEGCAAGHSLVDDDYEDINADALVDWALEILPQKSLAKPTFYAHRIYQLTSATSPLRKLIVDLSVYVQNFQDWDKVDDYKFSNVFLTELAVANSIKQRDTSSCEGDRARKYFEQYRGTCHYHCHPRGKCYRRKGTEV